MLVFHLNVHTGVCVCVYVCVHTCVCMCLCVCVYTHVCGCVHEVGRKGEGVEGVEYMKSV